MKEDEEIKGSFFHEMVGAFVSSDIKMESVYSAPCRTDPWESHGSQAQKLLHAGRIRTRYEWREEIMSLRWFSSFLGLCCMNSIASCGQISALTLGCYQALEIKSQAWWQTVFQCSPWLIKCIKWHTEILLGRTFRHRWSQEGLVYTLRLPQVLQWCHHGMLSSQMLISGS